MRLPSCRRRYMVTALHALMLTTTLSNRHCGTCAVLQQPWGKRHVLPRLAVANVLTARMHKTAIVWKCARWRWQRPKMLHVALHVMVGALCLLTMVIRTRHRTLCAPLQTTNLCTRSLSLVKLTSVQTSTSGLYLA